MTMKINAEAAHQNVIRHEEAIVRDYIEAIEECIEKDSQNGLDWCVYENLNDHQDEVIAVLKQNGFQVKRLGTPTAIVIHW